MKVTVETHNYYKKDEWLFIVPTLSVGYYKKFISISFYILNWELSLNFDFE